MDYVISFIDVVVWPAFLLFIIFMFKEAIKSFVDRLSYFKAGSFELNATNSSVKEILEENSEKRSWLNEIANETGKVLSGDDITKLTREDLTYGRLKYLSELGVVDPNIQLFLAVFENNKELAKEAVKNGASLNVKDNTLIRIYNDYLSTQKAEYEVHRLASEFSRHKHKNDI